MNIKPASRLLSLVFVILVVIVAATAVQTFGKAFGLWGDDKELVTIICHEQPPAGLRCSSNPIEVSP